VGAKIVRRLGIRAKPIRLGTDCFRIVMAGLVPAIHVFTHGTKNARDI
jgi:hypothetical protein